jgi:hypothetical protein
MTKVILALVVVGLAGGVARAASTPSALRALPSPSSFSARVDNPWFPLRPRSRYVYTGVKDGRPSRDVMTVSKLPRVIMGVHCVVVFDRLYERGHLAERTTDWYSQDAKGNVWYFGEKTAELDAAGHVRSTSGTWTAGVNGAQPGIYMPADPRVGDSGRQEFYKRQAEDHFKVIGLLSPVTGARSSVLLTQETTPLEPGTIDHKMYVRGVGTVLEQTEKGPNERNELVAFRHGS